MTIATGMSLTGARTGCMTHERKQKGDHCNLRNQVAFIGPQEPFEDERKLSSDMSLPLLSDEDKTCSASFHLCGNGWFACWLFLVASYHFLMSKSVNLCCSCRINPVEKVSSPERTIPNLRIDQDDATAMNSTFSCYESSRSSHGISKCDTYSDISDLDRMSYMDSLLSLEEEDAEWLSDSKPSRCSSEKYHSTHLSYKSDSFSEISELDRMSYLDSLLSLEEEDSEWLSDSKPSECSSEKYHSTPLSYKCDSFSEISELDRASYLDSLLSLEEEDSEWLSDSKPSRCSFKNNSTPLSYKCDSFSYISDIDTPSYWDSLLNLEGKDSEWIPDSKQALEYVLDGSPSPSYKGSWGVESLSSVSTISSEDIISAEHLLETDDIEEFGVDEPLFWPFEGKLDWNSEESWRSFSSSPGRRLVFDSISTTSRIMGGEQRGDDAVCSVKSETSRLSMCSKSSAEPVTLECEDEKVMLKRGEVLSNKLLSLSNTFLNEDLPLGREYFTLDQELSVETLVGLKEFDGHEGLDSEFYDEVFLLDESLQ